MHAARQAQARRFAREAADLFVALGEDWPVAALRERLPVLDTSDADVGAVSPSNTTAST